MNPKKYILIVDDNIVNRLVLSKILSIDYKIIEAENGEQAMKIAKQYEGKILAIMLDLIMPILNGFEFLEKLKATSYLLNIPVIVTTVNCSQENEIEALKLGAWDFISKPYNPDIIKLRLKNAIDRSQLFALERLKYLAEFDSLTDIYIKSKFFQKTREMINENKSKKFVFVRFDIDRFQLINSFYGTKEGDKLLKFIAKKLKAFMKKFSIGTFGRIEDDIFAFCGIFNVDNINIEIKKSRQELAKFNKNYDIVPSFGLYLIDDLNLPIEVIYDRANLAAKQIKGNYIHDYAFYDPKMSEDLTKEQEITNSMNSALENNQFFIYLQAKYSLQTNSPCGAEALVRWNDPKKGLILPNEFIPIFERNGFISKLDYFVWESVCILLKKWIDSGNEVFPISVNVSRVDIYNPNFSEIIINLVEKYKIPPKLLNLELTESSYNDNPKTMKDVIIRLQEYGFIMMMDDFGSGYSSLSILKDMSIDILKIDMRFLSKTEIEGRGENIIASVIRMAKWLNIPVVVEGVETLKQVTFLKSIGCDYVQGYYFSKPMPISQYEQLIEKEANTINNLELNIADNFNISTIFNSNPQVEMLFSNLMEAIAIYEFYDDKIELLRVNEGYFKALGFDDISIKSQDILSFIDDEYKKVLINCFKSAILKRGTCECEYMRYKENGHPIWIELRLKYINEVGGKQVLFGSLTDITVKKEIDNELQKYRSTFLSYKNASKTVLIVDPIESNRQNLKCMFQNDFKIIEAENGEEAMIILSDNRNIDIILLELIMPKMDGTEFLIHRKMLSNICNIPVIIITSDNSPEQQVNTIALGANDYIVKPFVEEIVIKRVNNLLESHYKFDEVFNEFTNK